MLKRKPSTEDTLKREYHYATHHHLIPLYAIVAIVILATLVMGCFTAVLWQISQKNSWQTSANQTIADTENLYVPAALSPAEKKQYIYPASIRFPLADPYNTLRYSYDPGSPNAPNSSTIVITTDQTLRSLEAPIRQNPWRVSDMEPNLQQCSRLFIIRFVHGDVPYGGFEPVQDVKLKDGRTATISHNIQCVPSSTAAMNQLDELQQVITAVESY